jgi:hypothetical protein
MSVFYFRKEWLSTKWLHFLVFGLKRKTILQYLPDIILWYYIKQYWRTVFLSYTLPTIALRLERR